MQSNGSPSPLGLLVGLVIVGWVVYRRTRPQRVRLERTLIYTAVIVLVSVVGLLANPRVFGIALFLALAPVALVIGVALGWLMMRTIRFWRDESTDHLWMSGGVAYVAIWLGTVALRLGLTYLATGSLASPRSPSGAQPPSTLSIIASDLLFLSIGLWLARGYALVQRFQMGGRK